MKKLIILLILLAVVLFTAGCTEGTKKNSTDSQGISEKTAVTEGTKKNSTVPQGTQEGGAVVELTRFEQINTSLKNGPVFVKIGAEWCEPCQEMKPILNELATEYKGKAAIMAADIDKSVDFSDYFVVSNIPDSFVIVGIENGGYVYMQEDGKVSKDRFKARILGLRDKEEFENILNLAIQKFKST
jgi:thioredoxin 1